MKSSISTLENCIKSTEGSSGKWETFGLLCAFAVGIGIAGEIAVIVSEYRETKEEWRRGIIRAPDKPPAWRFWFDIVATLIVLGGVFGEAGSAARIASINNLLRSKTTELRAKSELLLTVITEVSGDAATSAHNASADAGQAKTNARDAQSLAQSASGKAQSALADSEKTESEVTDDRNMLEGEQQLRREFETAERPRELPYLLYDDNTTNLDDLKKFKIVGVKVLYEKDAEAMRASTNLVFLFKKAGWNIISVDEAPSLLPDGVTFVAHRHMTSDPGFAGLGFQIDSLNLASTLEAWLRLNGWTASSAIGEFGEVGPTQIEVRVGFKPNPYFDEPIIKQARAASLETLKILALAPNAHPDKKVKAMELEIGTMRMSRNAQAFPNP